ncbi:transposase [Nocardia tengchongensis]|uniref:transposase n=1 Tax=Nocardia tengchongensis TaxID=2055889 RepID=UPI0036C73164
MVRRFAHSTTAEELLVTTALDIATASSMNSSPTFTSAGPKALPTPLRLFDEIAARGYRGRANLVHAYLHPLRAGLPPPRITAKPPVVRRVVGWLMTDPAHLDPADGQRLDSIPAANPALASLAAHVRSFATILCHLRGRDLERWMTSVDNDDQPALRSFVRGLRQDLDAVTAGLSPIWNSGAVEGHVNRIEMIQRQMSGRANLDLLRRRILLSD